MPARTLCGLLSILGGVERWAADNMGGVVASEGDDTPARSFASALPAKTLDASSEFLRRRAKVRLRPLVTVLERPLAGWAGVVADAAAAADDGGGACLL